MNELASIEVRTAAIRTGDRLGVELSQLVIDGNEPKALRIEAIRALGRKFDWNTLGGLAGLVAGAIENSSGLDVVGVAPEGPASPTVDTVNTSSGKVVR